MLKRIRDVLEGMLRLLQDRPFVTDQVDIQGTSTSPAYSSGDQFGLQTEIAVPTRGVLISASFYDLSDQGIAKDVLLFRLPVRTLAADNGVLDIKDEDMRNAVHTISFSAADFVDYGSSRLASVGSIGKGYYAPQGKLYAVVKTYGADTVTAGQVPKIELQIL